MNGTWRIETGHSCMHAMHVVHAHSSSYPTTSGSGAPRGFLFASRSIAFRRSRITRMGSSALPVVHAGQTDVHRPHTVQASSWSRSNRVNAFVAAAPSAGRGEGEGGGGGTPPHAPAQPRGARRRREGDAGAARRDGREALVDPDRPEDEGERVPDERPFMTLVLEEREAEDLKD